MMDNDSSFYENPTNSYGSLKTQKNVSRSFEVFPAFLPLIRNVVNSKAFGVKQKKITLVGCSSSKNNSETDRFKFSIPYADQMLSWMVLFDQSHPELGPDFEFDDKTFLCDPNLEELENNVPSLVNWNPSDPDCLVKVIMEFVIYYRKYQVEKLQIHERLALEYNTLLQDTEVCEEDVEVVLIPDTIEPTEARFFIRMSLDFSRLPRRDSDNTDHDGIMLQVTYFNAPLNRIVPILYLSVRLEDILGNSNTLHLPPLMTTKSLSKYVPEIKKLITDKINSVIENYEKKRGFIATAIVMYGGSVVEYDSTDFSFISLLNKHNDFFFFLHIKLSNKFPSDPPKYTLQSCYQINFINEIPKHAVHNVLYSPRWEPCRMLTEAINHIIKNEIDKLRGLFSRKKRKP
ncbi:BRISC and BRCA1-A complex member 2 isoform X2 [Cotesia typhae]|uniref:BRISC and BRCA1-A complex member 2 isoform X2 n=1 Tax=Cotesia typhae TaxID=2053667 RepID=UPI003D69EC8B